MMPDIALPSGVAAEALNSVRGAVVIADAHADDLPIIYANPAFENLTGYRIDEVIGRNCRFLQGPDTSLDDVRKIRQALAEQCPLNVVLHNYRRDGSVFLNDLYVNPIRNAAGEVTHFIGCQSEVRDVEAARLRIEANQRIGKLSTRERQVLSGLVHGATMKEISQSLELSPRTLEKYRYRMQQKMGTTSLALLVRYVVASGLDDRSVGADARFKL